MELFGVFYSFLYAYFPALEWECLCNACPILEVDNMFWSYKLMAGMNLPQVNYSLNLTYTWMKQDSGFWTFQMVENQIKILDIHKWMNVFSTWEEDKFEGQG